MIWLDILLEKEFANELLETVFSRVFSIEKSAIKIINDITEIDETSLVCLTQEFTGGQFRVLLTLYTTFDVNDANKKLSLLANHLGVSLLVANDESNSPYSMVQYFPSGGYQQVEVDPDELDSKEEYSIKS